MDERHLRQYLDPIYEHFTKGIDEQDRTAKQRHQQLMRGIDDINRNLRDLIDTIRKQSR